MIVYFDTSAIQPNFRFQTTHLKTVLASATNNSLTVCVSEIVINELKKNYVSSLNTLASKQRQILDEWTRLTPAAEKLAELTNQVASDLTEYSDWLDNFVKDNHIDVLPVPDVNLDLLLEQDLLDRRPWKKGDGFRDVIIWHTFLELVGAHPFQHVIFVSQNSNDFFAPRSPQADSPVRFHSDLIENVGQDIQVRIFPANSASAFVNTILLPLFDRQSEAKVRLEQDDYPVLQFEKELFRFINSNPPLIRLETVQPEHFGFTSAVIAISLLQLKPIARNQIWSVRELANDSLLVRSMLDSSCELELYIEPENILDKAFYDLDDDARNGSRIVEANVEIVFECTVVPSLGTITSMEVQRLSNIDLISGVGDADSPHEFDDLQLMLSHSKLGNWIYAGEWIPMKSSDNMLDWDPTSYEIQIAEDMGRWQNMRKPDASG